jgi:hypothetical protein
MSEEGLDALRARVCDDVELARRLRRMEPERFVSEVPRIAAECGVDVAADDVQHAIAQGRHAWNLRWIR